MILKRIIYNIKCDGCGKEMLFNWVDSEHTLKSRLITGDYTTYNGRHYCQDCAKKLKN